MHFEKPVCPASYYIHLYEFLCNLLLFFGENNKRLTFPFYSIRSWSFRNYVAKLEPACGRQVLQRGEKEVISS